MNCEQSNFLERLFKPPKRQRGSVTSVMVNGHRRSVHFSSSSGEWSTPQWLFDELDQKFKFTLDPCSTHSNAKCKRHFTVAENGLAQDWSGDVVFMNPPYGREIGLWMKKAFETAKAGGTVVCLVPARTDTAWWHGYSVHGVVRFLEGRLKFGTSKNSAPFPSAIVFFFPFLNPPSL
ncbi:MAG: phage N-6-adenine-methyltransferase [Nitrososphaera sp.]|nr:phage N-6-adenine-methyltransferase [Nitrososphaera sp.]